MIADADKERARRELEKLELEHSELDSKTDCPSGEISPFELQRLKRRKLQLKDSISYLRNILEDDIIA